jgi:hypothetical protein
MLFHQYNREVENGITNEEFVEWCLGRFVNNKSVHLARCDDLLQLYKYTV